MEFSGLFIVAMFAVGMGISFFVADPQSRTSRSLSAALTFLGLDIAAHASDRLGLFGPYTQVWPVLSSICEAGALLAAYEWILRVGRTRMEADCRTRAGEKVMVTVVRRGRQLNIEMPLNDSQSVASSRLGRNAE